MDDLYEEYEDLISKIARQFWRRYHGSLDDLITEANHIFVKSFYSFDPQLSDFETRLRYKIWNGLIDLKRQEIKLSRLKEDFDLQLIADHHRFSLGAFMDRISADAAIAVGLCFSPTRKMKQEIKKKGTRKHVLRRVLKDELKRRGWNRSRIDATFTEVRESLCLN